MALGGLKDGQNDQHGLGANAGKGRKLVEYKLGVWRCTEDHVR